MKRAIFLILLAALFCSYSCQQAKLAKPTDIQYKWHEQERLMFLCIDPCTWQGREYDNHSIPLERINPARLNTDQWCEVAQSWGAKEILFVAKHTGGFCWWQTESSDYSIKNTSYKDGKGDVLKELSESCKKYGLNLGIYVYPGDETWGAGIGSGGRTKDPSKQEAYNEVFRTQLTEVLTKYGDAIEVWFDGSCIIDVSDILQKHAKNSVVLQGPHATIRWPGTESGKLFYPAWNSVKSEDLKTGVSTQIHGNPNGDAWAPLEADTPLYDHHWFWAPRKAEKRKSIEHLMECFYRSVGHGGVFLLNSTPDTTGLIPAGDVEHFIAFRKEIDRRFETPICELQNKKGKEITLELPEPVKINHAITMEDYRQGERIREYNIEGLVNGQWVVLVNGISVGRKKIDYFDEVEVSSVRLNVTKAAARPLIRSLSVYYVDNFSPPEKESLRVWSKPVELITWEKDMFVDGKLKLEVDLSDNINVPGQYTIQLVPEIEDISLNITDTEIHYEGQKALDEFVTVFKNNNININRTAQITDESSSILIITVETDNPCNGKVIFKPALIY